MRQSSATRIAMLVSVLAPMVVLGALARTWFDGQSISVKSTNVCWFLTPTVKTVLSNDLVMWTEHLLHNEEATMNEWYTLRVPEVVAINSNMGVTEQEVTDCLDTLRPE